MWLNIRISCAGFQKPHPMRQELPGPPKFLTLLSTHTTLFVDPDRPSRTSPLRSLCVGFWHVKTIAACFKFANGAVSSLRECGLPCGLRGSLCTLQPLRSASPPPNSCNTRYGWLVRPYPMGTSTPQEAPSYAWRTNIPSTGANEVLYFFDGGSG